MSSTLGPGANGGSRAPARTDHTGHTNRADPADPMLGRTVGRYVVDKKIGEGGMGAIYRLRHHELPNTFQALKVLRISPRHTGSDEREVLDRFLQEARAAAAVGSHRVVQVFDTGQFDDGTRYLVMEYVPGRSADAALAQRGPLPVLEALMIAVRVADTLALAHRRGIIHRDVKPANLMLLTEGRDPTVKLLDFGVARATGETKVAHTTERRVIGSPGYMSPEAVIGTSVDGRADVFSLGVTLFELLAGVLPFGGATANAALMNTISQAAPSVSSLRPPILDAVSPAVEDLIARALAKEPERRPTMAAFQAELVAVCDALAWADRGGPVGASVMRALDAATVDHCPTLSDGAASVAELIAKYGPAAQLTRPLPHVAEREPVVEAAAPEPPSPSLSLDAVPRAPLSASVDQPQKSHGARRAIVVLAGVILAGAAGGGLLATRGPSSSPATVATAAVAPGAVTDPAPAPDASVAPAVDPVLTTGITTNSTSATTDATGMRGANGLDTGAAGHSLRRRANPRSVGGSASLESLRGF